MTLEAYSTLRELKVYAGVKLATADHDVELGLALDGAQASVDWWCGRSFVTDTTATPRVFAARWCDLLEIDDAHEITAVGLDLDGSTSFETSVALASLVQLPLNGIKGGISGHAVEALQVRSTATHSWPASREPLVQITAKWGWAATPIPVATVTRELAKDLWKSGEFVAGSIGFGEAGVARIRDTPSLSYRLEQLRKVGQSGLGGFA